MSFDKEISVFVTNIQRFCVEDGPGIRTTVFLKGCPLRCLWCHNPETHRSTTECMQRSDKCVSCGRCIPVCPENARSMDENGKIVLDRERCKACGKCAGVCPVDACEVCGKEMTVSGVLEEVAKDSIFYTTSGGGMTVSGGEPAAHPSFTLSLIEAAKERGIGSMIETSGFGERDFFLKAASLGAGFLFDLKEIDDEKHKKLCGVSNRPIHENLSALADAEAEIHFRLPLIPGVNDSDGELEGLAKLIRSYDGKYRSVRIMPYHAMGTGKAAALGRTQITVDPALFRNECASSMERWKTVFRRYEINLENK